MADLGETTIGIKDGKAIFYYKGCDGIELGNENYIKKVTIELTDKGVNVTVEDVTDSDDSYKLLDYCGKAAYVEKGEYTHTNQIK